MLDLTKLLEISHISTVSSFQASTRFQKCFHLQVPKKISSNRGIIPRQEKMITFSSNQGILREEIFVKSRQPLVRRTRQVKADFGNKFSSIKASCRPFVRKFKADCKKIKSNEERLRQERIANPSSCAKK